MSNTTELKIIVSDFIKYLPEDLQCCAATQPLIVAPSSCESNRRLFSSNVSQEPSRENTKTYITIITMIQSAVIYSGINFN